MNIVDAVKNNQQEQFENLLRKIPLGKLINEVDNNNGYNIAHYIILYKRLHLIPIVGAYLAQTPHIFEGLLLHNDHYGRTPLQLTVIELVNAHKRNENILELIDFINMIVERYPQIIFEPNNQGKSIFDLLKAEMINVVGLGNYANLWENHVKQYKAKRNENQTTANRSDELFRFLSNYPWNNSIFKGYFEQALKQNRDRIENVKKSGDNLWIFDIKNNKLELIEWLIDENKNGSYECGELHNNLLHLCIIYQRLEILNIFVNKRAFHPVFINLINQYNDQDLTPICYAAATFNVSNELKKYISLFVSKNSENKLICNLNLYKDISKSLFNFIILNHSSDLLSYLIDKELGVDFKDSKAVIETLIKFYRLLDNRQPLLSEDEIGNFVRILEDYKNRVLAKLLHEVIENNPKVLIDHLRDLTSLLDEEGLLAVLNYHVNSVTSLQLAIQKKQFISAKTLIESDADYAKIQSREIPNRTAQEIAKKYFNSEEVNILDDLALKYRQQNYSSEAININKITKIIPSSPPKTAPIAYPNGLDRKAKGADNEANKELQIAIAKRLQIDANKKYISEKQNSGYITGLTYLVINGVINGLSAINFSKRVPGLTHDFKLDFSKLDHAMKLLLESIEKSIIEIWKGNIQPLHTIKDIVIAKLCEKIRDRRPPIVVFKDGKVLVNSLNGYSFTNELRALQQNYLHKKPKQIYSITHSKNFTESLDEMVNAIIREIFPIEAHLNIERNNNEWFNFNEKDNKILRKFLSTRLLSSQIFSTLYSQEMFSEVNEHILEAHYRLIKGIAACLNEHKEVSSKRIKNSTDILSNIQKIKQTLQQDSLIQKTYKLFYRINNEWQLQKHYRKNNYYALYDNIELCDKINSVINNIESEVVKINPDYIFPKIKKQVHDKLQHAFMSKFCQVESIVNAGIDSNGYNKCKDIKELSILNQQALQHSNCQFALGEKFKTAKIYEIMHDLINETKGVVQQHSQESKLSEEYTNELLRYAREILINSDLLNKILSSNKIAINEIVLFDLLAKYFYQGMYVDYIQDKKNKDIIIMTEVEDDKLSHVHRNYSFLTPNNHQGADIKKWFLAQKNSFNEYYGIQLEESDLIASYQSLNLQYANQLVCMSPPRTMNSHGLFSRTSEGSRILMNGEENTHDERPSGEHTSFRR